jgi:hypothetical protein
MRSSALLADPALRASYARAARARIEENFDARRQAGRLLEIFSAIHAEPAPAAPAIPVAAPLPHPSPTTEVAHR